MRHGLQHANSSNGRVLRNAAVLGVAVIVVAVLLIVWLNQSSTKSSSAPNLFAQGLVAQNAGDYSAATADYLSVIALSNAIKNPTRVTATYYDLGVIAQQFGHVNQAVSYYSLALSVTPHYNPALFNAGVALTSSDPKASLGYYNKILATTPNDANTLYNAGLIEYMLGKLTLGRTMIKHAISVVPALATKVPLNVHLNP